MSRRRREKKKKKKTRFEYYFHRVGKACRGSTPKTYPRPLVLARELARVFVSSSRYNAALAPSEKPFIERNERRDRLLLLYGEFASDGATELGQNTEHATQ